MERYKTALILGLGKSGMGAARLLHGEGTDVTAVDRASHIDRNDDVAALIRSGVRVLGGAADLPAGDFDVCVVSPGIPNTSPWIDELRRRGVPLLSELELGWTRRACPVLAVTGTNGKSTAVKWCAGAMRRAGYRTQIAGNYGISVCDAVRRGDTMDWMVVEISSFQLETVRTFRPDVGILLNIQPNHLDRHGDMERYTRLKLRIFEKTRPQDTCVAPDHLPDLIRSFTTMEPAEWMTGEGRWVTFGSGRTAEYRYENGRVWKEDAVRVTLDGTRFDNEVYGLTASAVVAGLDACGIPAHHVEEEAREFEPLPHRMEEVLGVRGVRFVNDSKSTNLAAVRAAATMTAGPIRLIAGGQAKETDFQSLKEVLAQRVKCVYCIGNASGALASAWSDVVPCRLCGTLDRAVREAWDDAVSGETVLLSPGCASFDQFHSYEARGERFIRLIRQLAEEEQNE